MKPLTLIMASPVPFEVLPPHEGNQRIRSTNRSVAAVDANVHL
jgi:hypothetical protein